MLALRPLSKLPPPFAMAMELVAGFGPFAIAAKVAVAEEIRIDAGTPAGSLHANRRTTVVAAPSSESLPERGGIRRANPTWPGRGRQYRIETRQLSRPWCASPGAGRRAARRRDTALPAPARRAAPRRHDRSAPATSHGSGPTARRRWR